MSAIVDAAPRTFGLGAFWRSDTGIPVRNLWVLLVYASDLANFRDRFDVEPDDNAELPDVLAHLLSAVVERRLRRILSRAYDQRRAPLSRVRGRMDWLETISGMHLERGRVVCRFEDLTFDTTRNRLVRAALEAMAAQVSDPSAAANCRRLAREFARLGVAPGRPSRKEMSLDRIAAHQVDDRLMVTAAQLALDLVLPSETAGKMRVTRLEHDEVLLRRIFEKAVAGFYHHELHRREGWKVRPQAWIGWAAEASSAGALQLLPAMRPDLMLERAPDRRIVLDTKFTGILTPRVHGGESFKSTHIYQLYAYLSSQAGRGDSLADEAEGVLLYPSLDRDIDEIVTLQGHRVRFVTVNLASKPDVILDRLRSLAELPIG